MAMKWTPDRPTASGDYWFRRDENKRPQVVRVQGDKVTFRSGKAKNISNVQGEWGGAVSSSDAPISSHFAPNESPRVETSFSSIWKHPIALLLIGAVIGALLNEPYLTHGGEEKRPEFVQDLSANPHRISITVFPIFRNWGLKPGHIETVEFSPRELHLYPEGLKLNYCDKAPITILSIFVGQTIICNFVASIDPQKQKGNEIWFQVSYIVPGGHAVGPQTYNFSPILKPAENKGGK